ncbi:hypothetical protein [Reyranella sp.]|uniref:hypothetical protein n=1 Tax=Reyranella sp. TaxID=1929291 RepID=UPI003D0C1AB2
MGNQIDALELKYRKYAEAYGAAAVRGDVRATNRNSNKLAEILTKLRACGEQGKAVLRRLMNDGSDAIAVSAAFDSLPFAETEALKILDVIAKKAGPIALDAMMCAKLWRAGELKIC